MNGMHCGRIASAFAAERATWVLACSSQARIAAGHQELHLVLLSAYTTSSPSGIRRVSGRDLRPVLVGPCGRPSRCLRRNPGFHAAGMNPGEQEHRFPRFLIDESVIIALTFNRRRFISTGDKRRIRERTVWRNLGRPVREPARRGSVDLCARQFAAAVGGSRWHDRPLLAI